MSDKVKFGIEIEKMWSDMWSFGVCFSHSGAETYLFINLFKWTISIGKIFK